MRHFPKQAIEWMDLNKKNLPRVRQVYGKDGGGDEGDRTPDLSIANAALSQLSYIPTK